MYMATQAEGILVTAGQIYVNSLDAAPRETDVISGVASIDAGEITADEITVSNLNLSGSLLATGSTQFTSILQMNRATATQIGIGIPSGQLLNDFQVGVDDFSINPNRQNLVIVNGNVVSTNIFATNTIKTTNDKFLVESGASNVVKVTGNTFSSNLTVGTQLVVGTEVTVGTDSNVAVFKNGNVVVQDGFLRIFGDVDISGNLAITEIPDYTSVNNLVVSNAVIQMGTGNNGTYDTAVLMVDQPGASNIFLGYTQNDDTFKLSRTFGGPTTANFTLDSSNTTNLHILGEFYTQNNAGIANSTPMHTLAVGSNLYIDDTAGTSNLLHANGYGFFEGLRVGDSGLTVGSLITMDADAPIPVVVNSVIQTDGLITTGALPAGVANSSPTDTLSIGDVVFVNAFGGNALTIVGNTVTSRLITESIRVQDFIEVEGDSGITSVANVLIHADTDGPDTTSNAVTIVAGPVASNTSLINVFGARSNPAHQLIQFMTKRSERMRISSEGNVGIANTAPTDKLTVGGTVRVIGSNTFTMGTGTNYMKAFSDVSGTQTKIESRVGTGKGLNFYASTTDAMGVPKMTILETSNVGIGTTTPQGRLHTSGGTVIINGPVQYDNSFNNLGTPLLVSNVTPISNSTLDVKNIMHLTREGTSVRDGVRATFKMGKYNLDSGKSRSKLDIFLSDDRYTDETEVLTLRADGRVGIGHTQPTAHLEVKCTGIGNPETNGLLVHNHDNGDSIMSAQAESLTGNAFSSYILSDGTSRSGWSAGVANNNDFRITQNHEQVVDPAAIAMYISDSDRNVGIGTDAPRGKLEVNGDVVIGNQLSFGGLDTDQLGNTFIRERLYNPDGKSELVIFKGNEGELSSVTGPDRVRSIAPVHIFQTYDSTGLSGSEIETLVTNEPGAGALLTINKDRVLVGTSTDPGGNSRLFVDGGFSFAAGSKIITGRMDIFSTDASGGTGVIDNISSNLVFRQNDTEYARFASGGGQLGIGTNDPQANIHVYSGVTTDIDVLKLESPGTNTKTGIRLNTNDGYGGYVRGYTASGTTHGIVVGGMNNEAEADGLFVTHTSNVGVGTSAPDTAFHIYNGVARVESTTSSNTIIEIKTTGGTSNILSTPTGNVYVNPSSFETIINSNLEVTGDLSIDGKIDLGNQVAVDLGGATANTALHVGGGFISGSNEVACKRYSKTFTRIDGDSKDIQLQFGNGSFYAKIVAILRRRDGVPTPVRDMSTLVLEVQGGTHDESTSVLDEVIAVGTKNLFGGDTDSPWDTNISVGTKGIIIRPSGIDIADRQYSYDIHVELISSRNGGLLGLYTDNLDGVDVFTGEILQTYTY